MAAGYALDWFLFGSVRPTQPDDFAFVIGAALALSPPSLGIRGLRDADRSAWLTLFLFVPVSGWILLMYRWCEPRVSNAASAQPG